MASFATVKATFPLVGGSVVVVVVNVDTVGGRVVVVVELPSVVSSTPTVLGNTVLANSVEGTSVCACTLQGCSSTVAARSIAMTVSRPDAAHVTSRPGPNIVLCRAY